MSTPIGRWRHRTVAALFVVSLASTSWAQTPELVSPLRLRASGLSEYARSGQSVTIARDIAFIGASADTVGPPLFPDFPDNRNGSVAVFERDGGSWTQTARLVGPTNGYDNQRFGHSVAALDGTGDAGAFAIVGSPQWYAGVENGPPAQRSYAGRAYVFRRDAQTGQWIREAALHPQQAQKEEFVGTDVALARTKFGLVAVVGAPGYYRPGGPGGRAYVYARDPATGAWAQEAVLDGCLPRGTTAQYSFGSLGEKVTATAFSGGGHEGVVVGLAGRAAQNGDLISAGCFYARADDGDGPGAWQVEETVVSFVHEFPGSFTVSLGSATEATGGVVVALGLARDGRALVLDRDAATQTWARTAEIGADVGGSGFARSASLVRTSGGYALAIGADYDGRYGFQSGAGYLFARRDGESAWEATAVLGPPGASLPYAHLGSAIALSPGGWALLSSGDDQLDDGEGRTYAYDVKTLLPVSAETPAEARTDGQLVVAGANPTRSTSAVSFALAEAQAVDVRVYDGLGREVARVVQGMRASGPHRETFSVTGWAPGVYVVRLVAGERRETVRIVVAR